MNLSEVKKLLYSRIHEERLLALEILVFKFEKSSENEKKDVYEFYLRHKKQVNNWDLVDATASSIVGAFLEGKDKSSLYELSESESLWEKRIAMVSTHHFIKQGDFKDALKLCAYYLTEKHDLMHKASGWMLREVGKKDEKALTEFLDDHVKEMPRTMLRYSIERLPEKKRLYYLNL